MTTTITTSTHAVVVGAAICQGSGPWPECRTPTSTKDVWISNWSYKPTPPTMSVRDEQS